MKYLSLLVLAGTSALLLPLPASAQTSDPAVMERMERLERNLQIMQRMVARGEPVPPPSEGDIAAAGGPAQLEVRLGAMEEELRSLRGKIEENEFQNRKLAESMEKLQRDVEFRFSEMGGGAAAGETPPAPDGPKLMKRVDPEHPDTSSIQEAPPGETTAGKGVLAAPDSEGTDTPRDLYNHAFRLLNQTQYEEAASAFESFTKKYPKDPLVGNAYYWLGETYYIRRDYVAAADSFRQGFEVLPNGPKSADNLLKLSMSLDALNRDKEACVVLQQITTKYKNSSVSINKKAEQEQKRIGCK